jgi:imidazoleglycerol-phosphate dehydratase
VAWPDGSGRAEAPSSLGGVLVAEARVSNLGARGVIATGLPFLDHMIDQLTSHCQLGVSVVVSDSSDGAPKRQPCVDASGEDDEAVARAAGAALGAALRELLAPGVAAAAAAGEVAAAFSAPLDEAYCECAIALGDPPVGAPPSFHFDLAPFGPKGTPGRTLIGTYKTAVTRPFWEALAAEAPFASLSLRKRRGDNAHHIVEATFKSFARCLRAVMDEVEGVDVVRDAAARAASRKEDPASSTDRSRTASRSRSTKETTIAASLDVDGDASASTVRTGLATLDELLLAIATEGGVRLEVDAEGDLWIDDHHTTEDVAITVGQVLAEALGDKAGCNRMGSAIARTADGAATVEVVMDLSNRPYLDNGLEFEGEFVGDLSAEMIDHMFMSVATNAQMTAHIAMTKTKTDPGEGGAETTLDEEALARCAAEAFGKCLAQCVAVDPRRAGAVASSKGTLSV